MYDALWNDGGEDDVQEPAITLATASNGSAELAAKKREEELRAELTDQLTKKLTEELKEQMDTKTKSRMKEMKLKLSKQMEVRAHSVHATSAIPLCDGPRKRTCSSTVTGGHKS